jgi:hypothetical protein
MYPVRIVGNGLAAHVLAQTFLNRNIPFEVFAADLPGSASQAAWGLLNPVHLKTRTLTYGAGYFDHALNFFTQAQGPLNKHFLKKVRLRHFYRDATEAVAWMQAWQENLHQHIACENDFVEILHAASISIPEFIAASGHALKAMGLFNGQQVDEADMMNTPPEQWVIWATGHWASTSKLFGWVPLRPSAGVQAQWDAGKTDFTPVVQHRGYFLGQDPLNHQIQRIGSTYSWSLHPDHRAEAETEIRQAITTCFPGVYAGEELSFRFGYRPASGDRKPILGPHPAWKNHLFFNGLGSKGLLLAPTMAEMTADICVHSTHEIPSEMDIQRFYKRYKPFT